MIDPLQLDLLANSDVSTHLTWLTDQHVPLWAFLIALLTKPYLWAKYTKEFANRFIGEQTDNIAESDDEDT